METAETATQEVPRVPSMTLNITQKIIDEATGLNSSKCMIAQAIRHAGGTSTNVTAESATFNIGDYRYTYPLPARAAIELIKFDDDKTSAKPFTFTLRSELGFVRPVRRYPNRAPRGPTKNRASVAKRSVRRFHGLHVIEVAK